MTMTMNLSIRVSPDVVSKLDALAQATGRSRNFLFNEAVQQYIDNEAWQIAQIEEGLRDLEAGNVVPDDEMEAFWGRITTPEGMERARAEARHLYP